jgi:mannose-6-phosphate isomerase-like protein (cupin superfamily)
MSGACVLAESEIEPRIEDGTIRVRTTIDESRGCERLEQQVLEVAPGRSEERATGADQELLFVVSGSGTLALAGEAHPLEPDTAALLLPGERYRVETVGGLKLVSVRAPADDWVGRDEVVIRLADREEQRADENRTFRVLVDTDVTQFVGFVEPCRAPDHSHPYDEVGYILEGSGFAHVGGESLPIGAGTCFHLPPGQVHCIENTGPGVMRILGVFHPSGSPKQRAYDNKTAQ